ncbi:MAG: ABC transporter ATP-binding protein [Chlamydiota bacterium]
MKILKIISLSKSYCTPSEVHVLKEICFEVEQGESIAIMGKSGEGKSTLLHILGTLEKPSSGEIELLGKPLNSYFLPKLRNENIGFIFQTFNLLEDYTLLENMLMPAKIGRKTPDLNRAHALLQEVGLEERALFLTKYLSGGEKQRASIARALFNDPDLILADEPSGNLDRSNSTIIHNLLLKCVKERNKTLIVVTHDPELAELCDRKITLKNGKLT